ncbi:PspC domain-containing protein [Pedobacter sp. WC2423]|uniref:PspC domain-containing protein n=1 Tax=Pedobacter sp. WC2423 TaxID=3234142 RepID=UPI003466A512
MENRLLRNEHDKIIAGVSSGLAEYMQVDVTIIRLLFVLSTIFLVGTGIVVYLVMWIVVPVNNDPAAKFSKFNDYFKKQNDFQGFNTPPPSGQEQPFSAAGNPDVKSAPAQDWQNPIDFKSLPKNNDTGRTVGGLVLLVIGLFCLMNEFDLIPYWVRLDKLWPLFFVAIGLSFILKAKRQNKWVDWKDKQAEDVKTTAEQPVAQETAKPADQAPENQL